VHIHIHKDISHTLSVLEYFSHTQCVGWLRTK